MSWARSFRRVLGLGLGTDQREAVPRPQFSRIDYHIGSKDLRMPKKTHGRSSRSCLGRGNLLELLRRPITQGRVQPAAILVALDKLFDVDAQVIQIPVFVRVDLFSF